MTDERKAFEAWIAENSFDAEFGKLLTRRNSDGQYSAMETRSMWEAWRAGYAQGVTDQKQKAQATGQNHASKSTSEGNQTDASFGNRQSIDGGCMKERPILFSGEMVRAIHGEIDND